MQGIQSYVYDHDDVKAITFKTALKRGSEVLGKCDKTHDILLNSQVKYSKRTTL